MLDSFGTDPSGLFDDPKLHAEPVASVPGRKRPRSGRRAAPARCAAGWSRGSRGPITPEADRRGLRAPFGDPALRQGEARGGRAPEKAPAVQADRGHRHRLPQNSKIAERKPKQIQRGSLAYSKPARVAGASAAGVQPRASPGLPCPVSPRVSGVGTWPESRWEPT